MISFAYEVKEGARAYSIRSADEDYLKKDVEKVQGVLRRKGLGTMPLYLTEWNHTVADRNFINDSCIREPIS
jgi:beta-xylosidase